MNPRKKFKPRNSNSNTENEVPSVFGQIVSNDRSKSTSPGKHSPGKQKQSCASTNKGSNNNWQNANRSSPNNRPNNHHQKGSLHKNTPSVKRQLNYDSNAAVLSENHHNQQQQQQQQQQQHQKKQGRRSPRKNTPPATAAPFVAPNLSFSSPCAAEVPLPPTHWFSSCAREMMSEESNISAQLKYLLNVV